MGKGLTNPQSRPYFILNSYLRIKDMRKTIPVAVIVILAGIAALLPGCDQLVTKENYTYDTTTLIVRDSTCVEACHSDVSNDMSVARRQWQNSAHSSDSLTDITVNGLNTRSCGQQCHSTEGFLNSLSSTAGTISHPTEIGCFACHSPHTTWDFSLRDTARVLLITSQYYNYKHSNICARCHRNNVNPASLVSGPRNIDAGWGPHASVQADMLAGTGGYVFPDSIYGNSAHTTDDSSGCLTCHMAVTDGFELGGHTFRMRSGITILVSSCNQSGCHATAPVTSFYTVDSLQRLYISTMDSLKTELIAGNLLTTSGNPVLRTVLTIDSVAALYNYLFVRNDGSGGVHNTKYGLALLQQSLYSLRPPAKR
ncbi:hypothetical protein TRIP_C60167 [Candidatus Zixiibacteriota bacterium]|nr:hypothetical protein TRIP_C60167 [candidate division Zixibacteria bacterium]